MGVDRSTLGKPVPAPSSCQSGKPLIRFDAFEASIRRVPEKIVPGSDTNF